MSRAHSDPKAYRAALKLLQRGIGTPTEIAKLAGVPSINVTQWARRAGVRWRDVRFSILAKAWRKEMNRGQPKLVKSPEQRPSEPSSP